GRALRATGHSSVANARRVAATNQHLRLTRCTPVPPNPGRRVLDLLNSPCKTTRILARESDDLAGDLFRRGTSEAGTIEALEATPDQCTAPLWITLGTHSRNNMTSVSGGWTDASVVDVVVEVGVDNVQSTPEWEWSRKLVGGE